MVVKINNTSGGRPIEFSPNGEINHIEIIHRGDKEKITDYKNRISKCANKLDDKFKQFTTIKYLGSSKNYYRAVLIVWRWEGLANIWEKSVDYKDLEWKVKNIQDLKIREQRAIPKILQKDKLSIKIKTTIGEMVGVSTEGEIKNVDIINAKKLEGWQAFNERFLKTARKKIDKTAKPLFITFRRIPNFEKYKGVIVTWANSATAAMYYKKLDYHDLVRKIENPLELIEL